MIDLIIRISAYPDEFQDMFLLVRIIGVWLYIDVVKEGGGGGVSVRGRVMGELSFQCVKVHR